MRAYQDRETRYQTLLKASKLSYEQFRNSSSTLFDQLQNSIRRPDSKDGSDSVARIERMYQHGLSLKEDVYG